MSTMNIKLGPALKICAHINNLRDWCQRFTKIHHVQSQAPGIYPKLLVRTQFRYGPGPRAVRVLQVNVWSAVHFQNKGQASLALTRAAALESVVDLSTLYHIFIVRRYFLQISHVCDLQKHYRLPTEDTCSLKCYFCAKSVLAVRNSFLPSFDF